MAVSVEVPNLGEEMAGGVVAEWYLADGADVAPGDLVCRVESSYVAVDVEAGDAGLLRHRKPAGSIERPGTVLALILGPGEAMPVVQAAPKAAPETLPPSMGLAEPEAVEDKEGFDFGGGFAFDSEEEVDIQQEQQPEPEPEAVVLPFPRRFAPQRESTWDEAPGDAVEFRSSLFEPDEPVEALAEAGGSIPGLPLWEPEDQMAGASAHSEPVSERFGRISAEVAASAQVLSMTIEVDLREASRMVEVCAREWRRFGATLLLEDVVLRAVAGALEETADAGGIAGLVVAGAASDSSCAIDVPAEKTLREAVAAREAGGDAAFETAAWTLTSVAGLGVTSAIPRLDGGRRTAFAMGAPGRDGSATVTMAYDSAALSEGSAGRILARVRAILEAPYALLV